MDRAEEFFGAHPEVAGIVEEIPKEGVIAVILFGSHATGKAGPLSDIDLCIVAEKDLPREQKDLLHSYGSRAISLSLFECLPPAVQFRVVRDGVLLWGSEDIRLHRARVAAVRAYLNVRPLIDRHIQRTLGVSRSV